MYFFQASQHEHLIVISLKLSTQWGDPLGGILFALAHLHVLRHIVTTRPSCVFLSLTNDTHIVGPTSNVVPMFLRLEEELLTLSISVQPTNCVAWSPQKLDHYISLPPNFFTFNSSFHIWGTLMGSTSFVESFVAKVLHEDLMTMFSLPMFADPRATFVMFLLYYT